MTIERAVVVFFLGTLVLVSLLMGPPAHLNWFWLTDI
jgi:hypothetical protein